MRTPNYDRNLALEHLLATAREKRNKLDLRIAALEYLCMIGIKNGLVSILQGLTLEELGTTLAVAKANSPDGNAPTEKSAAEFACLLTELSQLERSALTERSGEELFGRLVALSRKHLGTSGVSFLLGLFVSAIGEGEFAREFSPHITVAQGKAGLRYLISLLEEQYYEPSRGCMSEETDKEDQK